MNQSRDIEAMLNMRVVAVLGCSPDPSRPSHQVAAYLMDAGYRVIPVHPAGGEILGEKCYPTLADVPEPVEVVAVFRRPEFALDAVRQAAAVKAKGVWLQDGTGTPEAAESARKSGLRVVLDDCMMRQHLSRIGR